MTQEDRDEAIYAMVKSGPPVPAEEVESHERAVEVVVLWGEQVLHVEHLPPERGFHVGEGERDGQKPGWLVGREAFGTEVLPVVIAGEAGPALVIPEGARVSVTLGGESRTLEALREKGLLAPCAELAGAVQYTLPAEAVARVDHCGFAFVVKPVAAGRRIGMGFAAILRAVETRPLPYLFGAATLAALLMTIFYFMPPNATGLSLDDLDSDSRIAQYVIDANELVRPEDAPTWLEPAVHETEGGSGERHDGEEGQMGDTESPQTTSRYGVEGPEDNPDPHLASERAQEAARTAGVLGVLRNMTGSWDSPTSPYGRDQALGNDPMSALGAIMGDNIGANAGFNGLGMAGTGRGAGGTGRGTVGLGGFGTLGHGGGHGPGQGYGDGAGGPMRQRDGAGGPRMRPGPVDVVGSLSKETIRRVVHRHHNEVRFCYEQQLSQRPDLEGRITMQFLIAPTGAVQTAVVVPARSNLADARVESCMSQAVRRWSFPAPDGGGMVNVSYPFMFSNSGE